MCLRWCGLRRIFTLVKWFPPAQEVEVMVLGIDADKHRISLGMKQCEDNPWESFVSKYPKDAVIEGEIKNVADFGIFVGLDGEIDGLIHASDLSWNDTPEEALKNYKKGDVIKALVLGADAEKERVSLGVKQLEKDPGKEAFDTIKKGQTITCTVSEILKDGIEVEISEGIVGFIKKSDLSRDRSEQQPDRFAVGDRLDAVVLSKSQGNRKASLSIKALEIAEEKRAIEEYGSADSGASLGDILGAALSEAGVEAVAEEEPVKAAKAAEKTEKADKTDKESKAKTVKATEEDKAGDDSEAADSEAKEKKKSVAKTKKASAKKAEKTEDDAEKPVKAAKAAKTTKTTKAKKNRCI